VPTPEPRWSGVRGQRSHRAILAAARALLRVEGPAAVTHQRVAAEARVGRATVYRHWPRPEQLLLDAVAGADLPWLADPRPPIREWLAGELRRLADELAVPGVAAGAVVAVRSADGDGRRPGASSDRHPAVDRLAARLVDALSEAASTGELRASAAPADAAAMLVGPVLYRTIVQGGAVTDDLIARLLDAVGRWRRPA
jgi:AcrR family transcriptional regulator